MNWRAKPLVSRQVIIDLIALTTIRTGLKVYANLTTAPTDKVKVSDTELATVQIDRHDFHPEWNYTIKYGPRT